MVLSKTKNNVGVKDVFRHGQVVFAKLSLQSLKTSLCIRRIRERF